MTKCVVCNRELKQGQYFCEDCLEKEIGPLPGRKKRRLSWLVFSPFQTTYTPPPYDINDILNWAVKIVPKMVERFGLSVHDAAAAYCNFYKLDKKYIQQILIRLLARKDDRDGPLWAPWDFILQPVTLLLLLSLLTVVVFTVIL